MNNVTCMQDAGVCSLCGKSACLHAGDDGGRLEGGRNTHTRVVTLASRHFSLCGRGVVARYLN